MFLKGKAKAAQLCLTFFDPMEYTIHEILQARILEWVAFPFSRGSSQCRDWTQDSHIAGRFFTSWATKNPRMFLNMVISLCLNGIFKAVVSFAVVTNDHKPSGLKPHKFIILFLEIKQSWKFKVSAELSCPGESVTLPFPASRGHQIYWSWSFHLSSRPVA